jgi:hypothetical protein
VDVGHLADPLHLGQKVGFPLLRQVHLQFQGTVEVVFHGPLAAPGDDQDLGDARVEDLLHNVLDGGFIDDGNHLFRLGLGSRKEPGTQAGRRDDRLSYLHFFSSPATS